MAEPTIVTWNFANWLTVVLMVALAFAGIGLVTRLIQAKQNS